MRFSVGSIGLLLFAACMSNMSAAENQERTIKLFSAAADAPPGITWKSFRENGEAEPGPVHEFQDGVLAIKGGPRGYLRTEQEYCNFKLSLEWRRLPGEEPGPGGVLVRMTGEDKIWPKCLEAQLNAGSPGDFWGLNGFRLSGPTDRLKRVEHDQFGVLTNLSKLSDAEKPIGQWNRYEIVAHADVVTLRINGRVVNRATGCDNVPGKICLTAEGAEIHFRNVQLTPVAD